MQTLTSKKGMNAAKAPTYECPICHIGLTKSEMGVNSHLRSHNVSFEDRQRIRAEIFNRPLPDEKTDERKHHI